MLICSYTPTDNYQDFTITKETCQVFCKSIARLCEHFANEQTNDEKLYIYHIHILQCTSVNIFEKN